MQRSELPCGIPSSWYYFVDVTPSIWVAIVLSVRKLFIHRYMLLCIPASVCREEDHFDVMQEDTGDGNGEVPQDIRAFFGHPLTAATVSVNGTDDNSASALALLHEYQNLPAIDKSDIKIGDRYEIADILR